MNILKLVPLLCLLATPVFSGIYGIDYPGHLLRRRNAISYPRHAVNQRDVRLKISGTPEFHEERSLGVQEFPRVARDLSSDVKDDLKTIFSAENFLSMAQKFVKIVLKIIETISSYVPVKSVKQAIEVLGFPGSKSVATIVEQVLTHINVLADQIGKSEFIVGKPTKDNFWKMLSDSILLVVKQARHLNAIILNGVKIAYTETKGSKYDILNNIKLTNPLAIKLLDNSYKFIGDVLRGLQKISNDKIRNTLVGFIKIVSLPNAKDLADIVDMLITSVNKASTELLQTKFIKEKVDIKNVNSFIVQALKTITITTLEDIDGTLKIILKAIQESKGIKVDLDIGTLPSSSVEKGSAIEVINKILSFLVQIDAQKLLEKIHQFVTISSRFTLDFTNDPGVKSIPDMVQVVGRQLTDIAANAASFIITHANSAAKESVQSKFVKEKPSWKNAKDFLHDSIVYALKLKIEITNNIKKYFDSNISDLIKVPNLVKEILEAIISDSSLSTIQGKLKATFTGISTLTGIIPSNAIQKFITTSGLPFDKQLSTAAMKIMKWVNDLVKNVLNSKFISQSPTIENAALALSE
ncbi:hypothetical protein L9F63_003344, partial [Diploptera punctata]